MSSQDPRILRRILEDLTDELSQWRLTARESLMDLGCHQIQTEEKVDQSLHQAGIVVDQSAQDQEQVTQARQDVNQLLSRCRRTLEASECALAQAQTSLSQAKATLGRWQQELTSARAWLERAENRLAAAINERKRAESSLAAAESDLSSARAALSRCESSGYRDSKGNYHPPNCSAERGDVSWAISQVEAAEYRLHEALEEEQAARLEVEQARARVNCCQAAVGYSDQAWRMAQTAVSNAQYALDQSERGLEYAHVADRDVMRAEEDVIAEQETAELMMASVQRAQRYTQEAAIHFRQAQSRGDAAQNRVSLVARELDDRVESLILLNRSGY